MLVGAGLTLDQALTTDAVGPIAVRGYFLQDIRGARLCEVLAESYPPQCGGANVALGDLSGIDLGLVQTNQDVSWTDDYVTILGEMVDGVFVPTPMSI